MTKTPPSGFVKQLKSFDKDLRVRWSCERRKWVIECKADRRGLYKPVKHESLSNGEIVERILPEKSDLYIGFHDGYYQVCYPGRLNDSVFRFLVEGNTQKYSRFGQLADDIQSREDKADARRERWRQSDSFAHSGEVYDYMSNRGSQAFPGGTSL